MFKIGQKVVFVDCNLPRHPYVVYPQINEIVTISEMYFSPDGKLVCRIKEYPKPLMGDVNGILAICFRPLDETFAENIIEKLEKEIKEELILN